MSVSRVLRALAAVVLVLACAELTTKQASAWPPPPAFDQFMIVNSTNLEVTGITVRFFPTDPKNRGNLATSFDVSLSRLPAGKSVIVRTGPGTQGIEGVARITGTGMAPSGNPLPIPATITAPKGNFDGQAGDEYGGFCSQSSDGTQSYIPRLEFRVNSSTQRIEAFLTAKWRWSNQWPQAVSDTSTFPNDPNAQQPPGDG